jgi:hypothetical protein
MSSDEDTLIEKLKERAYDQKRFIDVPEGFPHRVYPPVSLSQLAMAEQKLGFKLPPLLRRSYLEVGNGGFGPGFGLLALNNEGAKNYHLNLVDWYLELMNHPHPDFPPWPRQFITVCDWGCGITSLLDWTNPLYPVLRFNGDMYDEGPYENVMKVESASLQCWLEEWLMGSPLFELGRL